MAKKISGSVGKGGKNKPVDTSGEATLNDRVDDLTGNPLPSQVLQINAPASSNSEYVVAAFPIGDEFAYDPIEFGPATSLDFTLDVLAEDVTGTSHVDITLAVLQNDFFVAPPNPSTPLVDGSEGGWIRLAHGGFEARDFESVNGDGSVPDFAAPFQFAYAFHANYSTTALSVDLRLDNMEATVNTVPEPCTGVFVAIALGASVLWRNLWHEDEK
jgi:hypothetical protein